jgi:TonB family protein
MLLTLFCLAGLTSPCNQSGQLSELDLRTMASQTHLPSYPEDAKKSKIRGVAVVQIRLNEANEIDSVRVLEAPVKSIAEATKVAVWRWKFPPPSANDTPICMTGKLTFYFVIEDDNAYVRNPRRYASRN